MASPRSTCSILMTSAPQSARTADAAGTKVCSATSRMRIPSMIAVTGMSSVWSGSPRLGNAKALSLASHGHRPAARPLRGALGRGARRRARGARRRLRGRLDVGPPRRERPPRATRARVLDDADGHRHGRPRSDGGAARAQRRQPPSRRAREHGRDPARGLGRTAPPRHRRGRRRRHALPARAAGDRSHRPRRPRTARAGRALHRGGAPPVGDARVPHPRCPAAVRRRRVRPEDRGARGPRRRRHQRPRDASRRAGRDRARRATRRPATTPTGSSSRCSAASTSAGCAPTRPSGPGSPRSASTA